LRSVDELAAGLRSAGGDRHQEVKVSPSLGRTDTVHQRTFSSSLSRSLWMLERLLRETSGELRDERWCRGVAEAGLRRSPFLASQRPPGLDLLP
jgi:hypothetical protein